ncbi:MAG TPA: dTDP-4-dehydrorhamnose 3,5-epimerase [Mycobacteriales bacterium]|nr:dTDP-4-dehydrorhamnose 3,5-epimerase [Mycobacteriales bacterium]
MKVRELTIPDAYEISTDVFPDDRGLFVNPFRADVLGEAIGRPLPVLQTNHSTSRRGVVRGVHFSMLPPGQAKYVYVPRGAVLDIVVDIRTGSPTYGQHEAVRLDDRDFRALFLSEGLGHCAIALEDDTVLSYLCSTGYAPDREKGVSPADPALGLPIPADALLSPRDTAAPTLAEAAHSGLLPSYEDCRAFYRRGGQ